jgi:hypothetical protein
VATSRRTTITRCQRTSATPASIGRSQAIRFNDDVGGKWDWRPAARLLLQAGETFEGKRLRHLLMIWRGVSKRAAMMSFDSPSAANRTSLARMTSRYGDVYLRARASSSRHDTLDFWRI